MCVALKTINVTFVPRQKEVPYMTGAGHGTVCHNSRLYCSCCLSISRDCTSFFKLVMLSANVLEHQKFIQVCVISRQRDSFRCVLHYCLLQFT